MENWSAPNRIVVINPLKIDVIGKAKTESRKVGRVNPQTKEKGFAVRVITNGTAGYEDIVAEACHNTTLHKAEAKVALAQVAALHLRAVTSKGKSLTRRTALNDIKISASKASRLCLPIIFC